MTEPVQNCIWCKLPVRKSNVEHILPASLGCPEHFVLRDRVCMACNNGLGHVDQALLRDFEIIAFMRGVRRKGGRPPAINSWEAVRGRYSADGPELCLNAGPQMVEAWGQNLRAASLRNGIHGITAEPMIPGQKCTIKFQQQIGRDPKFRRAVYKVGFGTLTYFSGANEALKKEYDAVRAFVRKGIGDFDVLMMGGSTDQAHYFCPPVVLERCVYPVVDMAFFGVSFVVDFDPEQRGLKLMRERLTERQIENWMIMPRAA